jgi:hypothetical protein
MLPFTLLKPDNPINHSAPRGGFAGPILALLALALACLAFGAGCSRGVPPQSKTLDEHSRVTLADAWILDHTPRLLQVRFVYDGTDPNRTYDLKASLRAPGHDRTWGGGWIKQVPIPSAPAAKQVQVIWEFLSFPADSPNIFLRLNFKDRTSGLASSLEFKLPGARDLRLRKMGSQ